MNVFADTMSNRLANRVCIINGDDCTPLKQRRSRASDNVAKNSGSKGATCRCPNDIGRGAG